MIAILFKLLDLRSFNLPLTLHFDPPSLEDILGCPYDSVEVFDGPRIASLSMGKFCASVALIFFSSSDIMTVVFRSDSMITNTGFYAMFNVIPQGERESGSKLQVGFWSLKDRTVF